ncbi:MAG: hypothetical protein JO303_16940 [Caulobacteraceae bacterium]|nr:hypothetical protein [Caulobacteraceae bacterium]
MTFSYTLLLALILLFPGLCAWAALRTVERTDLLTPRPDKPNSTATLFVIVLGTLLGHLAGSFVFVLQSLWCHVTGACITVAFDPDVYRIIFTGGHNVGTVTDFAITAWLAELVLVGALAAWLVSALAHVGWVRTRWDAMDFGWLKKPVKEVEDGRSFILAYVVTKTAHDGANVAYEGIVQQIAMDDDQVITMLVLSQVDRFLVRVTDAGVERIDDTHAPIAQM